MSDRGCFAFFPAIVPVLVRRLTIRVNNNPPKVYPTLEDDVSEAFSFGGFDSDFNAIPLAEVNGPNDESRRDSVVNNHTLSSMGSDSEFVVIPLSPAVFQQARLDEADLMERGLTRRPEVKRQHVVDAGSGEQTDTVSSMGSESEFVAIPLSPAVPQQAQFIDEADLMERGLVRRPEVRQRHNVDADYGSMGSESGFAVVPLSSAVPQQAYFVDEAGLMERGLVRRQEVRQRHTVDAGPGEARHAACAGDTAALVHPKPQRSECVVWVGSEDGRSEVVERMVEMAEEMST